MKLLYLLLAVALVLNPLGCATSDKPLDEPTVSEQILQGTQDEIEQQEEKKVTVGTWFKMVGYLCLFGLFSPPHDAETEYITEVDGEDGVYNPQRKYKKEKAP